MRRITYSLLVSALTLASLTAPACGNGERRPVVRKGTGGSGSEGVGGMGGVATMPTKNCGDLACLGEGASCQTANGVPTCSCAAGYVKSAESTDTMISCEVDTSCVKIKALETDCRMAVNGPQAVGVFFSADYCAGTAVLPSDIGEATKYFKILEDGKDLTVEQTAYLVSRDVESFVGIVIDVSRSVQEKKDLVTQLTAELRNFIDALEAAPGKPPVHVSLMVFAKEFGVLVPFTADTSLLKSKLDELETDVMATVKPALVNYAGSVDIDGTSLWLAVGEGLKLVDGIRDQRKLVTRRGVLTTGTLIVISDGEDTNAQTTTPQIATTLTSVISLGVSNDIQGSTLSAIGRDGAFLAPDAASRTDAFAKIADRVKKYPERSYMLGYCSGAKPDTGIHTVTIGLAAANPNGTTTACSYDSSLFGAGDCKALFEAGCTAECGTILACGGCSSDACCSSDGTCKTPDPLPALKALDADCVFSKDCEVGLFCDPDTKKCAAANLEVGAECSLGSDSGGYRCKQTQHCARFNSLHAYCDVEPLRVNSACTVTDTGRCPYGTTCADGVCKAEETTSGGLCYYDWNGVLSGAP